jgi:anti-sigma factor RsiW
MSTHDQYGQGEEGTVHDAVAAYVLGILDEADATDFEAHLAGCQLCAVHLEEFSGMEPLLAMLADNDGPFTAAPASAGSPAPPYGARATSAGSPASPFAQLPVAARPPVPSVSLRPSPQLLDRLVGEVAVKRAKRKRRGMYLVAAAAALIIGGPMVALAATAGDGGIGSQATATPPPGASSEDALFDHMPQKVHATDPATKVSATIGLDAKAWGTNAVLELKNVKGPLKCTLVAVSKTGEEETLTSWAVPTWGYGIADSPVKAAKNPLYVHGGAAMQLNSIDHFDVRTFDGKQLVEVGA